VLQQHVGRQVAGQHLTVRHHDGRRSVDGELASEGVCHVYYVACTGFDLQHLAELGARRIGERHTHDASSGILPEETALEWCQQWLAKVKETQAA